MCMKELRQSVALTVATMTLCDCFLNPSPTCPDRKDAVNQALEFAGVQFSLTKVDVGQISVYRLVLQAVFFRPSFTVI